MNEQEANFYGNEKYGNGDEMNAELDKIGGDMESEGRLAEDLSINLGAYLKLKPEAGSMTVQELLEALNDDIKEGEDAQRYGSNAELGSNVTYDQEEQSRRYGDGPNDGPEY